MFLLDEDAVLPLPQACLSDPVYQERQRAFRKRVADAGTTVQRVGSPDRLETLLFHALTELRQQAAASTAAGRRAGSAGDALARVAVRVAPRPVFLAGREDLLAELDARLAGSQGAGPAVVALCGMGGAGKTSVAVEYAHRRLEGLGVIWQLAAEEPAALAAGFGELGAADGPGDPVARVHGALARRADWLLVFDNVPGPATVRGMLPPAAVTAGW